MERLNRHMAEALSQWSELTVIGPSGCRYHLPEEIEVIEVPARPLSSFVPRMLRAAWKCAARPYDLVLAGSGLSAPAALLAARRCKARAVAYVHGLDLIANHPVYRAIWLPCLRRLDLALANSANTAAIAMRKRVARGNVKVIHPGVTMPPVDSSAAQAFREERGFGARPILLSVGRMTPRKGLREFVSHALPIIRSHHPDVLLAIIGDEAPDALQGAGTGKHTALQSLIRELGLSDHVVFLGCLDDANLSQAYFAADVHVFPVRDLPGDIEGFGMVAIEAAAHGLPTVAFAVGGVPDAVLPGRNGVLVEANDYASFAACVIDFLASGRNAAIRSTAREAMQEFTWDIFASRLQESLLPFLGARKPPGNLERS